MMFCSAEDLKDMLNAYITFIHEKWPGLVKMVRHPKQLGLATARVSGWEVATGDVVAILDAHIEVHVQWYKQLPLPIQAHCYKKTLWMNTSGTRSLYLCRAEPLLARIKEDRTLVVSPVFDKVKYDDLGVISYNVAAHGFDWALWCLYELLTPEWYKLNDPSQPGK